MAAAALTNTADQHTWHGCCDDASPNEKEHSKRPTRCVPNPSPNLFASTEVTKAIIYNALSRQLREKVKRKENTGKGKKVDRVKGATVC